MMMLRRSTAGILRGVSSEGGVNALWKSTRRLAPAASIAEQGDCALLHGSRMLEGSSVFSLKGFLEVCDIFRPFLFISMIIDFIF